MENQNKPSLAGLMANQIFRKTIIGRVWVAMIGVEQHTFRTTVFGFEWARHQWKTQTNHHWQHTWGTEFPKIKLHWGVGWRRLGLSNTLFVLLCSGLNGCGTIGNFKKKQSLGTPIGDQMSEKNYHWEVGVATIGVEQHTFRTTVFVCVCGCGAIGAGRRRFVASNPPDLVHRKHSVRRRIRT